MGQGAARSRRPDRPDIYAYHDALAFLRDWLAFLKESDRDFSVRRLAVQAKLGSGYIPMVLSGERSLTARILSRLLPHLKLNRSEQGYLENIASFSGGGEAGAQVIALSRMSKRPNYQKRNPAEAKFISYMSNWYYIAIRELAALPDFRADAEWIQERLRFPVPIVEVKTALEFLLRHGYLIKKEDGSIAPSTAALECNGDIYQAALAHYHRQMFSMASESIVKIDGSERELDGLTFGLNAKKYEEAKKIIDEAMQKLVELEKREKDGPTDRIYHLEFALFPLSQKGRK